MRTGGEPVFFDNALVCLISSMPQLFSQFAAYHFDIVVSGKITRKKDYLFPKQSLGAREYR